MELYVHIPFCVRKNVNIVISYQHLRTSGYKTATWVLFCMKSDITDRQWDVRLFLLYI